MQTSQKYFFILMGTTLILFFYVFQKTDYKSADKDSDEGTAEVEQKVEERDSLDLFLTLKNIMDDEEKLKVSAHKQIFFVESHMEEERTFDKPRAACAVESAGLMNPDLDIYFLFSTRGNQVKLKVNDLVKALYSYKNIHLRFANVLEYSKGTRLQNFFERDELGNSSYPIEHASDVLRGLTLNKYGGQYLDSDAISLVPLKTINRSNYACTEVDNIIAGGIIALDLNENGGKKISDKYLELLDTTYQPHGWSSNGPIMITSAIHFFCNETKIIAAQETKCGTFTAFPTQKCYPIMYQESAKIFKDEHRAVALKRLQDSNSFFFHVWNKVSSGFQLTFESKSAYVEYAKKHCPKTYQTLVKYFRK